MLTIFYRLTIRLFICIGLLRQEKETEGIREE